MDDATVQEVVNLNNTLCSNIDRSGPLPFHESSGKILPGQNSLLQEEIIKIKQLSDNREMVLNAKKTKLFIANFTKIHQFKPMLFIPGESEPIEVILETKLLGYWLTSDMKPHKHVQYIVSRSLKRIFAIRRLKSAGCSIEDLIYVYILLIRSILETACPVFHPLLTNGDKENIERIQKIVLKIILGYKYNSYSQACQDLNLLTLDERRRNICLNFGIKCLSHPHHNTLFPRDPASGYFTRHPDIMKQPWCKTSRYEKSPVPYIAKLLNEHFCTSQLTLESQG